MPVFQYFLRGMETIAENLKGTEVIKFQYFLRGMETKPVRYVQKTTKGFQYFLRGMETSISKSTSLFTNLVSILP